VLRFSQYPRTRVLLSRIALCRSGLLPKQSIADRCDILGHIDRPDRKTPSARRRTIVVATRRRATSCGYDSWAAGAANSGASHAGAWTNAAPTRSNAIVVPSLDVAVFMGVSCYIMCVRCGRLTIFCGICLRLQCICISALRRWWLPAKPLNIPSPGRRFSWVTEDICRRATGC
jgi:hypothetical protein